MKKAAVLGSGPAGMLAAHACASRGWAVSVLSEGKKSVISGAQFLHSAIPMITNEEPDFFVTFETRGVPSEYRDKVYGARPGIPFVSMEGLQNGETRPAWDLGAAYAHMWDGPFGRSAQQNLVTISPAWLEENQGLFDIFISTIPLNNLCRSMHHTFSAQEVLISRDKIADVKPDTIVYNAERSPSWYRASLIQGIHGCEWSATAKPPYPNLVRIRKPLWTNCDCWPWLVRAGRFGEWRKGVLVDDAFRKVMSL